MYNKKIIGSNILSIENSKIRVFFDLINRMEDVISLCIGEPCFQTPKIVKNAAIKSINEGKTFYTENSGIIELRKEIAKFLKTKYNLNYDAENEIIVTVGATEAIDIIIRTVVSKDDEVLIPDPSFLAYKQSVILAKGKPIFVPTKYEDGFILKPEILKKYITNKSKVLFLSYPNNPTGATISKKQLEEISFLVKKHNLIVVSDEIYSELNYEKKHFSIAGLPSMKKRTIVINGMSKTYSMTGWRIGYIACENYISEELLKVHQNAVTSASTTSQYAALAALKYCEKDIVNMKKEYNIRRNYSMDRLKSMGLEFFKSSGAFYLFPSIKKTGLSSEEFATRLLKEKKVGVIPGNIFGDNGEGYIRIAYCIPYEDLVEAYNKLEEFIQELLSLHNF